jgi:hypothetical protein
MHVGHDVTLQVEASQVQAPQVETAAPKKI